MCFKGQLEVNNKINLSAQMRYLFVLGRKTLRSLNKFFPNICRVAFAEIFPQTLPKSRQCYSTNFRNKFLPKLLNKPLRKTMWFEHAI